MSAVVAKFGLVDDAGLELIAFNLARNKLDATADPTVNDDETAHYAPTSLWARPAAGKVWILAKNPTGAAQWIEIVSGGGSGAPTDAEYIVKTAHAGLSAERVLVDDPALSTVVDWSTAGQVNVKIAASGIFMTYINNSMKDVTTSLSSNSDTTFPTTKAVKTYVDNYLEGLKWKLSVRAIATTNGTLATAYENGDTVDGVVLVTGDRIALAGQTTATENGIYTVNSSGAPSRTQDANTGTELVNAAFMVTEGTANGDTQWVVTNDSITLGSTNIVIAQRAGPGVFTADNSTLELVGNQFREKDAGTTNAKLANMAAGTYKMRVTASTGPPEDGTAAQATAGLNVFVQSGGSHAKGLVPDPGASAGTTKFLCEDATFKLPSQGVPGFKGLVKKTAGSGTYTPTTGTTDFLVFGQAGGGGSGGVAGAASSTGVSAGAGSGGWFYKWYTGIGSSTYSYSVGTGGAAGAAGNNAGSNGNNTTFDSGPGLLTANGGQNSAGGAASTTANFFPGGGGSAISTGTGEMMMGGNAGGHAQRVSGTVACAGKGADSPYGQAGVAIMNTSAVGNTGTGYGSGGSGSMSNSATTRAGVAGQDGVILIWEFGNS